MKKGVLAVVVVCAAVSWAQVPTVYEDAYSQLETKLEQLKATVHRLWDGEKYPTRFCSDLSICNTQIQKTKLLSPGYYALTVQMLDALADMGMSAVRFNFSYPFLVGTFPDSDAYLDLFRRIVQAARDRQFTVFIKCTSTNTNPEYGSVDSTVIAFMNGLTVSRYRTEKKQMIQTIIEILEPDFFTIEDEPETMEDATGLDYSPDSLASFIQHFLDGLDKGGCLIGAGVGTWEPLDYVDRLVAIPGLDYLDIHVYPVNFDFFDDRLFYISDRAMTAGKKLVLGECWLFKTSDQDILAQLPVSEKFKRDVFSFWFPLDSVYTRLLADFAYYAKAEIVTLYWSPLFFHCLEYQPGYEDLSSDSLFSLTMPQALQNMSEGRLSAIGQYYSEIISEANDATPVPEDRCSLSESWDFELTEAFPNPFNPETTIGYTVSCGFEGIVDLSLYDSRGRYIRTLVKRHHPPGRYRVVLHADDLPSGLYYYRLKVGDWQKAKKMILLR